MELCNEIAGSYKMPSSKNIAATMKLMDNRIQNNYTSKKISKYLLDASLRNSSISGVMKNIYKVHEMHTKANIVREKKLRRATRMSIIHPHKISEGNYNS